MRYKKEKLGVLFFLGTGLTLLHGQSAVVASGGDASGIGSASYSVGQVVYTTINGSGYSSAQGVQQAYNISIVTASKEEAAIKIGLAVFPNPVTDLLILSVSDTELLGLNYELTDNKGLSIQKKKMESKEMDISMSNLADGIYYLRISETGSELKTFKIIKH